MSDSPTPRVLERGTKEKRHHRSAAALLARIDSTSKVSGRALSHGGVCSGTLLGHARGQGSDKACSVNEPQHAKAVVRWRLDGVYLHCTATPGFSRHVALFSALLFVVLVLRRYSVERQPRCREAVFCRSLFKGPSEPSQAKTGSAVNALPPPLPTLPEERARKKQPNKYDNRREREKMKYNIAAGMVRHLR